MDQIIRRSVRRAPGLPEREPLCCAFSGYRPQKMSCGFDEEALPCIDFKQRLYCAVEDLVKKGYGHFLSGGALGFDTFAAEAVMDIRRKYEWVTLEIAVPFDDQPARWPLNSQIRYRWILDQADAVTWVSHAYTSDCLFRRNRYLVDRCDLLLAAYDGQPGGTKYAVDYARALGRDVRILPPPGSGAGMRLLRQAPAEEGRTTA